MKTPTTTSPTLPAVLLAFAAVYLIWGSTYLAIRFAVETLPPFLMAGIRFTAAGTALFGWAAIRGAKRPSAVHWRSALVIGLLMLLGGNGLLTWSELYVPSGVAALIVATVPLWMVVLEALRPGGARPAPRAVFGLLLGLAAIALLIGPQGYDHTSIDPVGAAVICLAAFSWALGSVYSRHAPQTPSTIQNVGMQMLSGGAALLVLGYASGERLDLAAVSSSSAWSLVYLTVAGGIVGYSAYVWLLKVSTPARVSTYAYVNPVIAVLLGWALAGESLGPRVLMAGATVVTAVVLITWRRSPRPQRTTARCPQ
ncbi:MAG: EamA family transporter [Planctomycetota bacterium]